MSVVWLFDLDNTLHDASHAAFAPTSAAMSEYIARHLGVSADEAHALRRAYWLRYGATLLGLVRHHGVRAAHFLDETHRLPGLEARLRTSAHDRAALAALPGRKVIVTNAPRAYAMRVLDTLGLTRSFDAIVTIEDMTMFGQHRPKPDARMLRRLCARLKVAPSRCVLVEDTLEHQKAARRVGMRAVWMQRYLDGRFRGVPWQRRRAAREAGAEPPQPSAQGRRPGARPAYVYARIRALRELPCLR
ncbi:pyrimidine 5'-nucleotidase [Piscinibacter koreensis]|uniref:phosphoglycolate phosphatase n=1 Tax=Piscinibacter koreensis TaxID=2742824 RepID=A0A7Y6NMC4_9BURK|nr:pyrimidine 5'-nucleotidase [Schlegelella koreensis]NUZ05722.1 pyrimidine 5'-nucleotidase [Schlegelella koreensis]